MSELAISEVVATARRGTPENPQPSAGRILIIDDEAEIRESLETLLQLEGYTVVVAENAREGLAQFGVRAFDLILLDLALPDKSGMDVLAEIRLLHAQQAIIMITAYGTVENAVRAMQSGATNFIQKPWDNEKLLADVRAAVARQKAEEENIQLKRALKQRYNFENIVGKSEPMLKIFDLVAQVAPSRSTVLLQGESGTGKELIAKAIHLNSTRRERPFVPVNSGSTPPDLLESTLFGHVKGAFTSAVTSKKGLFEVADRGTLFLDEIGTMSMDTQSKILRVLQDRKFMHLGGVQEIQVDVRIIAATNVDLRQMVKEGRFREDLYYRLNVISLDLPPLRRRREDIPLLVHYHRRVASAGELLMARQRPRTGEHDRARRGALFRQRHWSRSAARPHCGSRHFGSRSGRGVGSHAVHHHGRLRTADHHRHAGEMQLEPDGSGGALPRPSLHSESENQAPGHRNQEEEPGMIDSGSVSR
jgi:DNA-binding NtrC family response regulator